jgi:hypothetical protein
MFQLPVECGTAEPADSGMNGGTFTVAFWGTATSSRESGFHLLFILPKSSFGEHKSTSKTPSEPSSEEPMLTQTKIFDGRTSNSMRAMYHVDSLRVAV